MTTIFELKYCVFDLSDLNFSASVVPSTNREIQFKNVQLNSREHTRKTNSDKPVVQPVATIEAVPLDLVEINIQNTKRKIPEKKNESGSKPLQEPHGNYLDKLV